MANKVIVVTGPREGVGKTTLAVNIAWRLSQMRHQPVMLIDTDHFCRNDLAQTAGAIPSLNVVQVLEQLANRNMSIPMLRGRVPLAREALGVLNIAANPRDVERLHPDQWAYFLDSFSQIYDIVVDLEITSPLKVVSLDRADSVVWSLLPNLGSIRGTAQQLDLLHNEKFGFQRFIFVVNQAGLPGSLPPEAVAPALARFRRAVDFGLPYDLEVTQLINNAKPILLEHGRSPYFQAMTPLMDRISKLKREDRPTVRTMPGAAGLRAKSGTVPVGANVVDQMALEKQRRWDAVKQLIHRELVEELNIRRIDLDTKGDPAKERQLRTNVESTVNALIAKDKDLALSREERERLVKELVDEALGLGPLEELLRDTNITEIMVNRFDQVYIERRGKITLSDRRFIDNNHVVQVIRRIIAPLGRRIDESVPMVDARLKDGSRVNAIIPPLAVQGPTLTIRRFPERAFTPADLIRLAAISDEMVAFLKICVLLKKNIVISGGTGTGKTTILNMLSGFIPNDERIITVEDTAELRMQQEHVVRLEARPANIEGQGQVAIRDLVKNCLRMRPDRIVIGECRGGEALDMLQAMNTGHDGSLTTVHANSPRDAFTRLETLCLMAGMDLPVWALREQIRSAVHIVVQLSRMQDGSRKVTSITEVTGRDDENILSQDLFRFVQDAVDEDGHVTGHHEPAGNIPRFYPELKAKGLALDLSTFGAGPKG